MKKYLLIIIGLVLLGAAVADTLTYGPDSYFKNKRNSLFGSRAADPLYLFINEVDDTFGGTENIPALYMEPTTAPATPLEGQFYYNANLEALVLRTSIAWETLEAGGDFASLDEAYNGGNAIDVDGSAVTMTVSLGDNNAGLLVAQNDSTNDPDAMNITSAADAATAVGLQIDCTAGFDVQGTSDSWSISIAGLFDGEGLTGLTNSQTISFDTNNEIRFDDNSEDVAFNFATGNTLSLTTTSGVDSFAFGVVDDLEGVGTIVFDAAAASITLTADAGAEDLTITQAGAVDASLVLTSAGTSTTDALILTSVTGSTKIDSADNLDIDAADDITIDTAGGSITTTLVGGDFALDATNASIILDAGEAVTDAINIDSAGGLDVDVSLSISLKSTENTLDAIEIVSTAGGIDITAAGAATEDIDITNTAGSVNITAGEDNAAAIVIMEDGGTSGAINIYADQGTGASATTEHDASVQLHSDDGGIGLYTTANLADAIRIETNGGVDEFITINNIQGTGADAITIAANAAGGDVNIDSVLGRIEIEAEEDVANALYLIADGGTSSSIQIFNDTGIGVTENAASINIWSDAGGIAIQSDGNVDDAVVIRADGGTTAEITIHNDQGNTADSIELLSDAGGIVVTSTLGGIALTSGTQITTGGGFINGSVQDIPQNGTTTAIALTNTVATVGADAGGDIVTLANGTAGQIMYIICEDATGTVTVTPATFNGGTSITFNAVGDTVTLVYGTDLGWAIVGGNSYTII